MKQCAIVKNGNDVIKVTNLKRKFKKICQNPETEIIEECDLEDLQFKYEYWKRIYDLEKSKKEEKDYEETMKYHFRNKKTGETITSIYPSLDSLKKVIKNLEDYERID